MDEPEERQTIVGTEPHPRRQHRREWLLIGFIFIVLLVLTIVSWALFNRYENQLPQPAPTVQRP